MAKETLITDLVSQEALDQLEILDDEIDKTLERFKNCAREMAKGLQIPVEVQGDLNKVRDVYQQQMREAGQATQQLTQQLQQQQQVVANTTNTISRQLMEQERLNKATREAYKAEDDALTIARKTLGTRQEHYQKLAQLTAQMRQNREEQSSWNKSLKEGTVTEEDYQGAMAQLLSSYDGLKYESQQLARLLAVENKEAQAAEGSYEQLSQQLELMKKAYKQMDDATKATDPGKKLEKAIQDLDAHLKDLAADMGEFQRNVGNYAVAAESAKSRLANLTNEIVNLTVAYEDMTDEEQKSAAGQELKNKITSLTEEAAKFRDAVGDVKDSIKGSASDTRWLDTMLESGQMIVSTFGLCSSAAQALGISNDTVAESIAKVQAAMQAVQALQVIQNSLQRQSNIMKGIAILQAKAEAAALKIETAARAQATGATVAQTAAMRVFNVVAKANPYVLLATAILTVVGLIIGYTAATEEATKADEEAKKAADERKESMDQMAQSFGNSAGEMIAKYRLMREQWNALGDDIKGKRQYLEQHKSDFDKLAQAVDGAKASVKGVDDVEKFFEKATPDVEKAIMRRARAMAAYAQYIQVTQQELADLEKLSTITYRKFEAGDVLSSNDDERLANRAGLTRRSAYGNWALSESEAAQLTAYMRSQKLEENAKERKRIEDEANKRREYYWKVFTENGGLDPANFSGGSGGTTKSSPARSGGSGGGNKEQVKDYQELRKEIDKVLLESYKEEEKYTEEWMESRRNAINKEAEVAVAANRERERKIKEELDKSLAAGKISREDYEKEVAVLAGATAEVEKDIEKKKVADLKALDDEMQKHREELAAKEVELIADRAAAEQALNDATYQQRLTGLYEWYNQRVQAAMQEGEDIETITEEFNRRKLAIDEEYANETVRRQIEALEKELEVANLSEEERERLQQELTKATADYAQQRAEQEKKAIEETVEADKKAREERMKSLQDWVQRAGEAISKIGDFMTTMYDNQISKIDEELEAEQLRYDEETAHIDWLAEHEAISKEEAEIRKRDAAAATQKKQEELEKKKSAIEYKKAVMEKVNAVSQIGIATALGIMQTIASIGWPAALPGVAFVSAMGALQTAAALAKPIKAYKEGTKGKPHPGGLAIVGDGGKPEVITFGGRSWVTPDRPTLIDLPKGAEVLPDMTRERLADFASTLHATLPRDSRTGQPVIINDYTSLESRVAANTKSVTRELHGFRREMAKELKRQRYLKYINDRL